MGIASAALSGRVEMLEALRNNIAGRIDDGVPARDLASLSRRLIDIDAELRAAEAQTGGDPIVEAAATPPESWSPSGGAQSRPA